MSPLASVFILLGAIVSLLAAAGLLKFDTPFARFHSAGKASPIAFVLIAAGAGIETGWTGAARLLVASAALVLTLPVGVHLLFRAVHRTSPDDRPEIDELGNAGAEGAA